MKNTGSHRKLEKARNGFSPRASGSTDRPTAWLWPDETDAGLLASRTVREEISVALSCQVSGNLLWQPWETSTNKSGPPAPIRNSASLSHLSKWHHHHSVDQARNLWAVLNPSYPHNWSTSKSCRLCCRGKSTRSSRSLHSLLCCPLWIGVAGCRVGAVTPAARALRTLSLVSVLGLSRGKAHVLPAPAHTCSVPRDGVPAWHREQVHCLYFQDKRFCSIPLRGRHDLGCECTQHRRHPPLTHRQPGRGAGQRQLRERDPKAGGSQRKVLGLTAPAPRGNSVVIESRPLPRPVNRTLGVKPSNPSKFYFSWVSCHSLLWSLSQGATVLPGSPPECVSPAETRENLLSWDLKGWSRKQLRPACILSTCSICGQPRQGHLWEFQFLRCGFL